MGMYTRLTFWAEINSEAAHVIGSVLSNVELEEFSFMSRPLQSHSYYHVTQGTNLQWDSVTESWYLNVDTSCKNYNQEIQKFLDWIHPHTRSLTYEKSFAGFTQREGFAPEFIWWRPDGWEFTSPGEVGPSD